MRDVLHWFFYFSVRIDEIVRLCVNIKIKPEWGLRYIVQPDRLV
jgi:hypothetical protein